MGLSGIHTSRGGPRRTSKNSDILSVLVQLVVAGSLVLLSNITVAAAATVPAVFMFGDGLADTGNNNYVLTSTSRSNYEPYGRDLPPGTPTGRFSNGRVLPDFIAETLGVKYLVPPFKDPNLTLDELLTGVSFGSAGAAYDPQTSQISGAIKIEEQLYMYEEYKAKITAGAGKERADNITSASPHLIVLGSNDVANAVRTTGLSASAHADMLVGLAQGVIQELLRLGAKKIGVVGVHPIGCAPFHRVTTGDGVPLLERNCAEDMNDRAKAFNAKLGPLISTLNQGLPADAKIVYLDIYDPVLSLILNPAAHGFEEVKRGCCGTGTVEIGRTCGVLGSCPDASKYLYWDTLYFTEKATGIISDEVFSLSDLGPLLG